MSKPTQTMFPAVVDATPEEELPTDPVLPLAERDTARPDRDEQVALQSASKASDWRFEPRWAIDYVTGAMVLAEPYTASQHDRWGNLYEVGCPAGIELRLPTSVAQGQVVRSTLVVVSLAQHREAVVWPHNGEGAHIIAVDDQWRAEITRAFVEGDRARSRG